ncbi:MAG: class I SAM-dependent methyltransferase [Vicinamibacteria bacterium]
MAVVLFEVFEALPRAAPGDAGSAERALALVQELPRRARVLDLGCGPGPAATLWLARRLSHSRVVAVDLHAPFVANARGRARAEGLADRVFAVRAAIETLPFAIASLDLVWAEGALYNAGDFARGVRLCREMLRPGGFLVCSEAVWLTADPAEGPRNFWQREYPAISSIEATVERVRSAGLRVVGHFTLPRQAWWTDFYAPMEARLAELRERHSGDAAALHELGQLAAEAELHRRHGDSYGYEMIVARRD